MKPLTVLAVTLDAYGTLFDFSPIMIPGAIQVLSEQGIEADPALFERIWTKNLFELIEAHQNDDSIGFRTIRELTGEALDRSFSQIGLTGDIEQGVETWLDMLGSIPLYPEVPEAVRQLATRYELAIVSDADEAFFMSAWSKVNLPIEHVFTSESARAYKIEPNSRLFAKALKALEVDPHEVIHVGDSRSDVIGAFQAGAKAIWLSRDGREWTDNSVQPTYIARNLCEAVTFLELECGQSGP